MKTYYILLLSLVTSLTAFGQVPQQFSFQGIARNNAGQPIANQTVGVRLTIHQGSAGGNTVYGETHSPQTSASGTFNVSVGSSNVYTGQLAGINWSAGPYFLQVELDPAGGSNYVTVSTSQLLSVPYALTAKNLDGIDSPQDGDMLVYKNNQWQKKPARQMFASSFAGINPPVTSDTPTSLHFGGGVSVTITHPNPLLRLNFSRPYGSLSSGGGNGLRLSLAYQRTDIPNQPVVEFTQSRTQGLRVAQGSRVMFSLSRTYLTTLQPGTYYIGFLASTTSIAASLSWNDNGEGNGTVEVEY